ncbi:hypothetical protein C8J45_103320 [Sphingomonas sp. PP-CE-3G-477]|nr:hypothetical protein [Sphingomonas sp. PP-CE-3G-477]PTQ64470.1 hypothetical protein C8J45_103320 [Sphingomonas sp. PP-CE-3G-477]
MTETEDDNGGKICCQWCGDMFPPEKMATAGLCESCVDVADEEMEP